MIPRTISARFFIMFTTCFLFLCLAVVLLVNQNMKIRAMEEAEEKAGILLERSLAIHSYFSHQLKPRLFRLLEIHDPEIPFIPPLMSSTYAVREIQKEFVSLSGREYYYKECAINARSPENEADSAEREFILRLNQNKEINRYSKERMINGVPFLVVMRRGEIMEDACLRCHGTPDTSPSELVAEYGPDRSFHRQAGETVSAISIRIPLAAAFADVDRFSARLSLVLLVVLLSFFLIVGLAARFMVFRPLALISSETRRRILTPSLLATPLPDFSGNELKDLTSAFNDLSNCLAHQQNLLESRVQAQNRRLKQEIEERRKTSADLFRKKEELARMFERAPLSYQSLDENGNFLDVNATWLHLMGYPKEEVVGKNFSEFLHPDWKEHFIKNFPRFKAVGEVLGVEFEMRKKDGSYILVSFHGEIGKDKEDRFQKTHCIFQDITTQRRLADEAETNKNILMEAEKLAGVGGWRWDIAGDHWHVTDNWRTIHRFDQSRVSTEDLLECVHPEDIDAMRAAMAAVKTTGKKLDIEYRIIFPDSETPRYLHSFGEARPDETDAPARVYGASWDITERKNLEARALQAQKMESIGTLSGGIAHDFNNLLYPIIGMAEMLLEDLPPESEMYQNAEQILKSGLRGSELVKQILAFSRQTEQRMMPVSPSLILKEVIKLSRSTIPSNISISADLNAGAGMVMADPAKLHQVFMNLVTNALHAVSDHPKNNGAITVSLHHRRVNESGLNTGAISSGMVAEIRVADNGTGIASNNLSKIFEPYFTTKEQGKGTGLGLALVYGIVHACKGEVSVESREGRGSTFTVRLPLLPDDAEPAPQALPAPDIPGGTERILVVDDEPAIANMEAEMLTRLGYRITACTSSPDALSAFRENPAAFDLVISDISMPQLTGDRLAAEIRSIRPDIPILLCTGFSERMNVKKAEEMEYQGLVMKPVVRTELARMIRQALDEKAKS